MKQENKELLFTIGMWFAVIMLAATNYCSYLLTKKTFSLFFTIIIVLFATYQLFTIMRKKGLAPGAYIYLSFFYLLGLLSLGMGVQSFCYMDIKSLITCIFMFLGDIALIIYTIKKLSK